MNNDNHYHAHNNGNYNSQNQKYVSAGRKAARRKKLKRRKQIFGAVIAFILLLAIIAMAVYIYFDSAINEGDSGRIDTDVVMQTAKEYRGDVVNVLVCGIDYDKDDEGRDYSDGKGMTDVIMYATFDLKNNKMSILQIPRDSYVGDTVPTGGTGKINAAYAHGKDQENRINNLARILTEQYGLPVDHYITIDMAAFKTIINTLGGIDMYVPWDIYDDEGNTVPQGNHKIDGATAEFIIRQRHMYNQGDLKRLELQQYFYAAVFKTFKTFPIGDVMKVMPAFISYVNTQSSLADLSSLAVSFMKLDSSSIYVVRAPGGPITINGEAVYAINEENFAALLNDKFRPYSEPVYADSLKVPGPFDYPLGEINDPGRYMGDISAESGN